MHLNYNLFYKNQLLPNYCHPEWGMSVFWSQPSSVEEHRLCNQEWAESESSFEEPYAFGTVISLLEPPIPHLENGHSNDCLVVMLEGLMKWDGRVPYRHWVLSEYCFLLLKEKTFPLLPSSFKASALWNCSFYINGLFYLCLNLRNFYDF